MGKRVAHFFLCLLFSFMMAGSLASCTAINVVTHTVSNDPVRVPAGRYVLDADHWSVLFSVDHLKYSRFVGRFDKVQATLDFVSDDPVKSRVNAVIEAKSVDTNVAALDSLLRGNAMFDAGNFPQITFTSTEIERTGPDRGVMTGDLTIRGRTHPVQLDVTFNGGSPNPLTGHDMLGFSAKGHFSRADFRLGSWYPAVGNDVEIQIQAEFVRAAAAG